MTITLTTREDTIFNALYQQYVAGTETTPLTFDVWFEQLVRHQVLQPAVERFRTYVHADRVNKLLQATDEELRQVDTVLDKTRTR